MTELHHINPLKSGLFPTAALPAGVRHSAWNLKMMLISDHVAAHAALRRAEGYVSTAFNPLTTAGRVGYTAANLCGCK